jgi:hypothetical protein
MLDLAAFEAMPRKQPKQFPKSGASANFATSASLRGAWNHTAQFPQ